MQTQPQQSNATAAQKLSLVDRVEALLATVEASQAMLKTVHAELKVVQKEVAKSEKLLKGVKKRVKKDKKAPGYVKNAMSSYICFSNAVRETVKHECPDMDAKELLSEIGARWKAIKDDPDKTAPYVELALQDKARYDRDMAERPPSEEDTTEGSGSVEAPGERSTEEDPEGEEA